MQQQAQTCKIVHTLGSVPARRCKEPTWPDGLSPEADPSIVKRSQLILRSGFVPGNDPSHFAYVNTTVHRNLYRIPPP
jgi:hypothetical protein